MTQSSPPVGPDYGLEPMLDHTLKVPPLSSKSLISTEDYRTGSEFGGVAGLIQPTPHELTNSEALHSMYALDPMDDGTHADSVAPPPGV